MLLLKHTYPLDAAHGRVNPLPAPGQQLLLQVALCPPDLALAAWLRWNREFSFETDVDEGSFALMGLVYRRAQQLSLPMRPDVLGRLRGIYRFLWSKNQTVVISLRHTVGLLAEIGLPVLVHKGLSLVELYYRDWGVRMTSDLDILLPESEIERTHQLLSERGWWAKRFPDERVRSVTHASTYRKGSKLELDVHWRPYMLDSPKAAEDALWLRAQRRTIQNWPVLVPETMDLLVLACFQGRKPMPAAITRWVADAAMLIKALDAPDWEQLRARADSCGLEQPVGEALRYLHDQYGLVPRIPYSMTVVPMADRLLWKSDIWLRDFDRSWEKSAMTRAVGWLLRFPCSLCLHGLMYVLPRLRRGMSVTPRGLFAHLMVGRRERASWRQNSQQPVDVTAAE
ncbi:MAG: nucleotidyltransferase family protein [Pseudomonadota bacterium]